MITDLKYDLGPHIATAALSETVFIIKCGGM